MKSRITKVRGEDWDGYRCSDGEVWYNGYGDTPQEDLESWTEWV